MSLGNKDISGLLFFVGPVIYFMGDIIKTRFAIGISHNLGMSLLGVFMIVGAYFLYRAVNSKIFSISLVLAGVGSLGVGVYGYLDFLSTIYYVFAGLAYLFFILSAIMAYKYEKSPFSYVSVILGLTSLIALILWVGQVDLRVTPIFVDFPILLWLTGFGAHLIAEENG